MMMFDRTYGMIMEAVGRPLGCLMAWFGKSVQKKFSRLALELDSDDIYDPNNDGKYGVEREPHVTVKYGIHEQDHDVVLDFVKGIPPIVIGFDNKFSLFENGDFDVLKINVTGKGLRDLNRRVCERFEHTDRYTEYNPHATLAYLHPGLGKKYVEMLVPPVGGDMVLDKLCYSNSKRRKKFIRL